MSSDVEENPEVNEGEEEELEVEEEKNAPLFKPCSESAPICLRKTPGKTMKENCKKETETDNNVYLPLATMKKILIYANENETQPSPMTKNENGIEETCYPYDRAWLVIIGDLIKRLEEMKTNPDIYKEAIEKLQDVSKTSEIQDNIKANGPLDLNQLFTQILEIGKKRFNDDNCKENDTEEKVNSRHCQYLNYFNKILINEEFKALSSDLINMTTDSTPEKIIALGNMMATDAPNVNNDSIDTLILLLKSTLPIMNKKEDVNESDITNLSDILNKLTSSSKGGGKN